MATWSHSRKGIIQGDVVSDDGEWMKIRLTGDHSLRYASQSLHGQVDKDGEIVTVRKDFLTEIK